MSAKKDGMANIGGFLRTNDELLAQQEKNLLILTEGYPTYGGLAGRDLEAIAVGVQGGALSEDYLRYRIASTAYLGNHYIAAEGVLHRAASGGHAIIWLMPGAFLPHIPLACSFQARRWRQSCICKEGSARLRLARSMFGGQQREMDLVRLAIPRRVYTQSHIDYVVEVILEVWKNRKNIPRDEADLRSAVPAALYSEVGAGGNAGRGAFVKTAGDPAALVGRLGGSSASCGGGPPAEC